MDTAIALPFVGTAFALLAPRLLSRARWQDREPVIALWVWQCVVAAVLLCFALSLLITCAAVFPPVRGWIFLDAPHGVQSAYGLATGGDWRGVFAAVLLTGSVHVLLHLMREAHLARISRRRRYEAIRRAAPLLPDETREKAALLGRRSEHLLVMENPRPQAWSLPLPARPLQLVVSTGAMRRLRPEQLDAVLAIERAHARARHHLVVQSAGALATAFPVASLFTAYADHCARLVELAADDTAAHHHGNVATAMALLEVNATRLGAGRARSGCLPWTPGTPPPPPAEQVAARADRLLTGPGRLTPLQRLSLTAAGLLIALVPVALVLAPGLHAVLAGL